MPKRLSIRNIVPDTWPPARRITVSVLMVLFLLIVVPVWFAGVVIVGEEILEAIQAEGARRFDGVRMTMLIFLAVLGAPLVLWRVVMQNQQVELNRQIHYTELFTKAVEQLGADKVVWESGTDGRQQVTERNIEVRMGAIYALERLMKDSERDAPVIVETLSAYVRENCGKPVDLAIEKTPPRNDNNYDFKKNFPDSLP